MHKVVIGALLGLAVLITAASAGATSTGPLDCFPGCRINVSRGTPTTYPAGQPFTIAHGVNSGCIAVPDKAGMDAFVLEVDGVMRPEDVILRDVFPPWALAEFGCGYTFLEHFYVFNFPDGVAGTHTFTGHWFEACSHAVDEGFDVGPCRTPAEQVEFMTRSLTVTFT